MNRYLDTRKGPLQFPAFLPVTTFGGAFPLDQLLRPYLPRYAPAMMVSYHYAKAMRTPPRTILFMDSGGFASLFEGAAPVDGPDFVAIRTKEGEMISPESVLRLQEEHAEIGATLDFIVSPGLPDEQAQWRQDATIRNALWALRNRKRADFRLYASVQAWDTASALRIMEHLAPHPFDGFAIGGMVPRAKRLNEVTEIIQVVRRIEPDRPLHVFGIGSPEMVRHLLALGVDSVDSSNYVRAAVDGKRISPQGTRGPASQGEGDADPCDCPVCRRLGARYADLEGEVNRMALALHNLAVVTGVVSR